MLTRDVSTVASHERRARRRLPLRQCLGLMVLAGAIAAVFLAGPTATAVLVVAATSYLVVSTLDNSYTTLRGIITGSASAPEPETLYGIADHALPRYAVIVSARGQGSNDVAALLERIGRIDYPADKLDVYLAIDRDLVVHTGARTRNHSVHLIRLSPDVPHDSAAVCNYATSLSCSGSSSSAADFVAIYNAGDVPDPQQLRQAAYTFATCPNNVAVLQAKLRCADIGHNFRTRMLATEYDRWFCHRAPALSRLGCMVPMAMTSSHIRTSLLREVGGWNPKHPTANIELAIRLARNGYRILILNSYTSEAVTADVTSWWRQGSSWYRGYLNVLAAYLRHPMRLYHELGLAPILRIFDVTAGRPLAYLANIGLWSVLAVQLATGATLANVIYLQSVGVLCLLLFLLANFVAVMASLAEKRS